jgi:Flp pilus assembly protein TadG
MNSTIPKRPTRPSRLRLHNRIGAVAAETALTLPVLFLVVFGSFEFARAHSLLHTADNAAYEGARQGILPGATAADCEQKAQNVLQAIAAKDATVTVTPSQITADTQEVTVDIEIPMNTNGYVTGMFFHDQSIHGQCTLKRERFAQEFIPYTP